MSNIKNEVSVRRFQKEDAEEVQKLIVRNFLEVYSKDYEIEAIQKLADNYGVEKILQIAGYAHMYVFELENRIVGVGSVSSFWGSETESILLTIFVLPELHRKGIGRIIMQTLEQDELYIRSSRIEIPASITSTEFYRKFGYDYKNGIKELDDEQHYRLEKYKKNNIRDFATINELTVLSKLETHNADMIRERITKKERFIKLQEIAEYQLKILNEAERVKVLS